MTIKTKLIANILVTAVIIVGISLAGFSSMRFLQEKLSYLVERSTPFQIGTVEFQRELQSCITNLIKMQAARNMPEYDKLRAEAETSLHNAKKAQQRLVLLRAGSRMEAVEELTRISGELFAAGEERIKSDSTAKAAQAKVSQQIKESSARLKELEEKVHNLQVVHAASFAKALANTGHFSARLRTLEELRNLVKELVSVAGTVYNATTSTSFLIASGKVKTLLARIGGNKNHDVISTDLDALSDDIDEFLQLHATALNKKDRESKKWAFESLQELAESMNRVNLMLNQEIELASSRLAVESSRQGFIFARSNNANGILLTNSELAALAYAVSGQINRLFTAASPEELDSINVEIRALFAEIDECAQRIEKALTALYAVDEVKKLHTSVASLSAIRSDLYLSTGIMAALRMKFDVNERVAAAADKLNLLVTSQTTIGQENASIAQQEQNRSIAAVNNMVRHNIFRIVGTGFASIVVGVLFGGWIYRSVVRPLRIVVDAVHRQREQVVETAALAKAVACGDLNREVVISKAMTLDQTRVNNDEMGMVLNAVAVMSAAQVTLDHAFAGMAASLRGGRDEETRRDHLKSGLYELGTILRDDRDIAELADRALTFIVVFLGAGVGIMYHYNDTEELLQAIATYALNTKAERCLSLGEGLAGQAALERKIICLNAVPPDYLPITSALGKADPLNVLILPVMQNEILIGVMEIGSFKPFCNDDYEFLKPALEAIAIALNVNRSRQLVNGLLEQSQRQAEELRVQQEELQQTNEELMERARLLAEQRRVMAETS